MNQNHDYCFNDNFSAYGDGEHPDDWLVERHTNRAHQHGWVESGAYNILFRGNKHSPLTPPLKDFTVTFQCQGYEHATDTGCYIFFRYDTARRVGYYIKRQWGQESGAATHFGVCGLNDDGLREIQSDPEPCINPAVSEWNDIRLEVCDNTFTVFHNDVQVARFKDVEKLYSGAGCVAFDRDHPIENVPCGPFFLRKVCIRAKNVPTPVTLWKPFQVEFPDDHNGIVSPLYYHLEGVDYGNHVQITARLTGGPAERDDPVLIRYRKTRLLRWQNEQLINPYLRLEKAGGGAIGTYYLFRGTVGLKEHWDRRAPGLLPSDIECPLERVIRLPSLSKKANVFIGYDFYEAEERNWMKGGPTEAWVDPLRATVISAGPPLKESSVDLEIQSPPDKAMVSLIPRKEHRREKALAFARSNHYFIEKERVRFTVLLRHRLPNVADGDMKAEWTLEDAFRQPLKASKEASFSVNQSAATRRLLKHLGVQTLVSEWVGPTRLSVGVYHIVARVRQGQRLLGEVRRAFEVLSLDPSKLAPPRASGLPELLFYESSDFTSAAAIFDPWIGRGVDEGHYVTHTSFTASFVEENQTDALIHLYRRKTWLWARLSDFPENLMRQADVVYSSEVLNRFDLWKLRAYRQPVSPSKWSGVFEVFLDFLQSPAYTADGAARLDGEAIRIAGELSEKQFLVFFENNWKSWLEFFNQWYAQTYMPQNHALVRAVNPDCEWGRFGPYAPYTSVYKSAWFPHCSGRDLRSGWHRFANGPMRFESYAYVCGYPIQREVFQLAAMKMDAPKLRLYPEIYSLTGIPEDFTVLLGSPPYARSVPPVACYRKRFFEFAYAAVWFGAKGFQYWEDNGFQPKHWDRDVFSEFLSAWSVIHRIRPAKPLRTTAFVYSRRVCQTHPDTLHRYGCRYYQDGKGPMFHDHDIYNTAEECVAFAYEEARLDGQCAGFITELDDIERLSAEDVHTLVLPPLVGLTNADLQKIRDLHARGINLVAFENVSGLEDLFGVTPLKNPVTLYGLKVKAEAARTSPWLEIKGEQESILHSQCCSAYQCKEATTIIEGLDARGKTLAPALVMHETPWGRTAFFTTPPTLVWRESGDATISYGKENLSHLVKRAMALVLRVVGNPEVETTAGKLIGFRDKKGKAHIILAEDHHPHPARNIEPIMTIRLPGLTAEDIHCDRPFDIVSVQPSLVRLCVPLAAHQCALISLDS